MTLTTEEIELLAQTHDLARSTLGMKAPEHDLTAAALRSLAAERDALRAENARLREALQSILPYAGGNSGGGGSTHGRQEIISHAWALVKGETQ
jgi:hypothetical protein